MKFILFAIVTLTSLAAFSQVTGTVAPTPAGQAIVSAVNTAASKVPASVPAGLIMALTFVISELAAHGVPTSKPLSWFLGFAAILSSVILLLQKVQNLCTTIGNSVQNVSGSPSS